MYLARWAIDGLSFRLNLASQEFTSGERQSMVQYVVQMVLRPLKSGILDMNVLIVQ